MTDVLEQNVARLIRRCHETAETPERLQRELLDRMYAWQDALPTVATRSGAGRSVPAWTRAPAQRPIRVCAPAPARPWGWWVTGVAATLLVALGLLVSTQVRKGPVPAGAGAWTLAQSEGMVRLSVADQAIVPAPQTALPPGAWLSTGPNASAALSQPDGTLVQVEADTVLFLGAQTPLVHPRPDVRAENTLHVEKGAVRARIPRRAPGETLALTTPHAEVFVRGTEFALAVQPDSTRIDMTEGDVDVVNRANRQVARVTGGSYAIVGATTAIAARPIVDRRHLAVAARASNGLLALYAFNEGGGRIVRDLSGVGAPLDLVIRDPEAVRWLPGGGLAIESPTLAASTGPATKINTACMRSGELSVECWVKPHYVDDPPHSPSSGFWPLRIVTLSRDAGERNFTIGQGSSDMAARFMGRMRTSQTELGGIPQFYTPLGSARLHLHHLVFARAASGLFRIYVDGIAQSTTGNDLRKPEKPLSRTGGDFSNWDPTMPLALANEPDADRPWCGTYYLVAIYDRALSAEDVARLFRAGSPASHNTAATRP